MTKKIEWMANLDDALAKAAKEKKTVLLDFFNPN